MEARGEILTAIKKISIKNAIRQSISKFSRNFSQKKVEEDLDKIKEESEHPIQKSEGEEFDFANPVTPLSRQNSANVINASTRHLLTALSPEEKAQLPPALQDRDDAPTRPPALSFGSSIIDRYWHLGDVLEDKSVSLSWRLRIIMALETIKELRKLHSASVTHGKLLVDSVLVDQECRCRLEDSGLLAKTADATNMQKDILCFGAVLVQLALHQSLELGSAQPKRPVQSDPNAPSVGDGVSNGISESSYANLKRLFSSTLAGEDISEMADSLEFQETLGAEVRVLSGFKPKPSENVPDDAISSFEELAVQCCSAMGMNRPEVDAIEDWLGAIVDMVGGLKIGIADKAERDQVLWALQPKDTEILGDISFADESRVLTQKEEEEPRVKSDDKEKGEDDEGYETDDSFMPPQTRRASRLSMFIEEQQEKEKVLDVKQQEGQASPDQKKKKAKQRMSIKPTQGNMEHFTQMTRKRNSSLATKVLTPGVIREKFNKQERLTKDEIMLLLSRAEEALRCEPNLPTVQAPVIVVGDLHGQYYDLVNLINLAGTPGSVKYLFLGDYVDRGDWSCEVLFYILSLKVAYPQHVTMIRGNHECDAVSSYFGFKEECEAKYGRPIFYRCLAIFQCMPVGCVLDTGGAGRFLCVHGGISPHVTSLEQFEQINRFTEPGMNGFMCDVLWSDPIKDDFDDGHHGKSLGDFLSIDFVSNPARGCSFRYGYSAIVKFLATNRLVAIIRAHEVMQEGFRYHFQTVMGGGKTQARIMPPVITVFSAPNYLGTYGNRGAFLRVSSAKDRAGHGFKPIDLLEPVPFEAVAHPVPIVLASETQIERTTIENACPYMPTTFDSFIARALEFANGDVEDDLEYLIKNHGEGESHDVADDSSPTIFTMETVTQAPGMEHRRKESLDRMADELRTGLASQVKVEMHGVDLKNLLPTNINRRQSLVELREKKGVSSLIAQFSKAKAADGINEMHPMLVQEKMSEAKRKIDVATPNREASASIMSPGTDTLGDVPIMSAPGRRTVLAAAAAKPDNNRKSLSKKNKLPGSDGSTTSSSFVPKAVKNSEGRSEMEIEFSEDEIVALQMLYLMIDRDGNGSVSSRELFQWSQTDGQTISVSDAQACIEALDMDEDGNVGFSDYLGFAASLKIKYQIRAGLLKKD